MWALILKMNNLLKRTIVLLVFFNLILSVNAVQETNEQKVAINIEPKEDVKDVIDL